MVSNLLDVLSECKRIIKSGSRHFIILFLIFLLPHSFSTQLFISFANITQTQQTTNPIPMFYLLYILFSLVFSTCSVITITYTVYHCFHGRPVKILSAINSISSSFLPLLATTIPYKLIILFVLLSFGVLATLVTLLVNATVSHSSPYLTALFVLIPWLLVVLYLQVNWLLAPAIVVVESCWGFEPLRKSTRLMKGMKRVALSYLLFFGFLEGIVMWISSNFTRGGLHINNVLLIGASSCVLAMFMLANIAVTTVLYIYCKANHGEKAEEFDKDYYVSVPFHDEKLSYAV